MTSPRASEKLYAVYLGGKAKGANIEVHDLVFVVSESVKAAFPQLRELWFGTKSSAHVDSWLDLSYIDGHRVELYDAPAVSGRSPLKRSKKASKTPAPPIMASESGPRLFMINVGYYERNLFSEQHRFHFLVCRDRAEAKSRARKLYLEETVQPHLDNVVEIDDLIELSGRRLRLAPAKGLENKIENVYWPLKISKSQIP